MADSGYTSRQEREKVGSFVADNCCSGTSPAGRIADDPDIVGTVAETVGIDHRVVDDAEEAGSDNPMADPVMSLDPVARHGDSHSFLVHHLALDLFHVPGPDLADYLEILLSHFLCLAPQF
jgi:hypothetical protein